MKSIKYCKEIAKKKRREKLDNHEFSIISNNCIGGVMTSCLGEQFRSPTVNLAIYEWEFCTFCKHLKEYSVIPVDKPTEEEQERFKNMDYPVGILRGEEYSLPDITIYFIHYHSFEEAKAKWEERFKRVNYDDLYFIMNREMSAKDETLDEFHQLPFEHKVFITHKNDPERWPCTFSYSIFDENYTSGKIYGNVMRGLGQYRYLDEFDYITWLNEGKIQRNPDF